MLGRLVECETLVQQTLADKECPSRHVAAAWLTKGALAQQRSRLDDALVAYRNALALEPDDSRALNNIGAVLKLQGKHEESLAYLRR